MAIRRFSAMIISLVMTLSIIFSMTSLPKAQAVEVNDEMTKLFYGYNVTSGKSLMANDALQSFPIIDPNSEYVNHILKRTGSTEQQSESFSSSSLSEVSNFIGGEIQQSGNVGIMMVDADISGVFNLSKSAKNCRAVFYDVYTTSITRYNYIVQLNTSEIRNYLSKKFTEEIKNIKDVNDAKGFLQKYGTHLNTGYSYGGRLIVTNYKSTSNSSIDFSEAISLESKISATIKKINAGLSGSIEEEYGTYENTAESKSTYKFKSYGGMAISSLTLDDLFTYNASYVDGTKSGFMYTRWIDSINEDKDLTIIGIPNGAQSIPVWNLLEPTAENSTIRQYLMDAYVELCGDVYIEFSNEYPEFVKTINEDESGNRLFRLNGLYVKTPKDYFYYVDADDFTTGGQHNEVHNGDLLYLDLSDTTYDKYDFVVQGCEVISKEKKIFRVTEASGNLIIKCKYNDDNEQLLCKVPIKKGTFEGGTGTEKYPYLIKTAEQFQNISKDLSANYLLLNDIDFNKAHLSPMGELLGSFDGNYCTLSNFVIDSFENWGLFTINSGTIKNLYVKYAGAAVSNAMFAAGGTDDKKSSYTSNSIQAKSAGIFCGENNGSIDNCYLENVYIRNIHKESKKYVSNSAITLSVGAIAGVNTGTISNCMVENSNVLNAFVYSDANNYKISIYSGLLVGNMGGGKIISCVADIGAQGTVLSLIHNNFAFTGKGDLANAYSTAFVGYCKGTATLENCYVFNRGGSAVSSKIDFNFTGFNNDQKAATYHGLTSTCLIFENGKDISSSNVNAYCATGDDVRAIKPSGNGRNNNKDSFTPAGTDDPKVIESKVDSEATFNRVCLDEAGFAFDSSNTYNSHIAHTLTKKDVVKVQEDINSKMSKTYYVGDYFNPIGIIANEKIADVNEAEAKVFKIALSNGERTLEDLFTKPFKKVGEGIYSIQIVCGDKYESPKIDLQVGSVAVTRLKVNDCEINYDNKISFAENFSFEKNTMSVILSDGTEVALTPESDYAKNGKVEVLTEPSAIGVGDNIVNVSYTYDGTTINSTFKLTVVKKDIDSIEITTPPTKTEYTVGDKVDIAGMELCVNYTDGSKYNVTGDEINNVELIDDVVVKGENNITVIYSDYSKPTKFTVKGTADKNGARHIWIWIVIPIVLAAIVLGIIFCRKKQKVNEKMPKENG